MEMEKVDLTFAKEKLHMVDLSQNMICGHNNQLQNSIGSKVLDSHIRSDSRRDLGPPRRGDNYPYGNETRTYNLEGHRPNLKPQQFDGSKPLREYLQHFKVVASFNRWIDTETGLYLAASLIGPAQRILSRVDVYAPGGYDQLLLTLQDRYSRRIVQSYTQESLPGKRRIADNFS